VTFIVVLVFAGALLLFGTEFQPVAPDARWARTLAWIIVWAFIATIAINMVVVFVEEGFTMYLPDDPTGYVLLQQLGITK
jgi:polyferredoxin